MGYRIKDHSGFPVIELEGSFLGGPETENALKAARAEIEKGRAKMVLDMRKVEYMNSSAIGDFVGLQVSARNRDGEVIVACLVASRIRNVLVLFKLDDVFKPCTTVEEAVALLKVEAQ